MWIREYLPFVNVAAERRGVDKKIIQDLVKT